MIPNPVYTWKPRSCYHCQHPSIINLFDPSIQHIMGWIKDCFLKDVPVPSISHVGSIDLSLPDWLYIITIIIYSQGFVLMVKPACEALISKLAGNVQPCLLFTKL